MLDKVGWKLKVFALDFNKVTKPIKVVDTSVCMYD